MFRLFVAYHQGECSSRYILLGYSPWWWVMKSRNMLQILFDVYVTVHRDEFLTLNQLDALIPQIYFRNEILHVSDSFFVHHQEFFTVNTAMLYVIHVCWQLASRIRMFHFGQFLCPSSGVFHCTHSNGICYADLLTACEQDQDVPSWSCSQLSANLRNTAMCTVKNSW